MTDRRSYRQYCGLAKALDVIGERWTLLVIRNLLIGPQRYSDLLAHLPGITTNLLAKRLKDLVDAGILEKRTLPPPAASSVYALTARGWALEPAIHALGSWGMAQMGPPASTDHIDIGWAMVSFKRLYRGGDDQIVEVSVDGRVFCLHLRPDYLDVREQTGPPGVLRVWAQRQALVMVLRGAVPAHEAIDSGAMGYEGSAAAFERFICSFRSGDTRP